MSTEPVQLSEAEVRMIRSLTNHLPVSRAGLPLESLEEMMRRVAREEIASLAGLVLSRTSMDDAHLTRSIERNAADDEVRRHLAEIFGEVLSDFSRTSAEPGA